MGRPNNEDKTSQHVRIASARRGGDSKQATTRLTDLDVVVRSGVKAVDGVNPVLEGRNSFQLHSWVYHPPTPNGDLGPELEGLNNMATKQLRGGGGVAF